MFGIRKLIQATIGLSMLLLPAAALAGDEAPVLQHTIRMGDTLSGIARTYGTTVDELVKANGIRGERIVVGHRLTVPWPEGSLRDAEAVKVIDHQVFPGESISAIAERYGSHPLALQMFNRLSSDKIKVGQILHVPTAGPEIKRRTFLYMVEPGDTLRYIADQHELPTSHVRYLNRNVDFSDLRAGQTIILYHFVDTTPAPAPVPQPVVVAEPEAPTPSAEPEVTAVDSPEAPAEPAAPVAEKAPKKKHKRHLAPCRIDPDEAESVVDSADDAEE